MNAQDLGPCCRCGGGQARNIMILPRRAPTPGTGWGCVVCGLPCDGAFAVLCDECAEACANGKEPLFVCDGFAVDKKRASYASLKGDVFYHDKAKHEADEA